MTTSQFIFYTSEDAGAPTLTGMTGSLLALLNACLVTGYGSKLPAGWLKPFADTASIPGPLCLGGFTMPSGSGFSFFLNDAGYNAGARGAEASVTGWERLTSANSSTVNISQSVGTGSGQFPLPAQAMTTGRVIWRKSIGTDFYPKVWKVMADAYTLYVFIQTGDTNGTYYCGTFGDFYSVMGQQDLYRCHIEGRLLESSSTAGANTTTDLFDCLNGSNFGGSYVGPLAVSAAWPNLFAARTHYGFNGGVSTKLNRVGDYTKGPNLAGAAPQPLSGIVPPSLIDSAYYIAPLWNIDSAGPWLRGRWRGMYHICHPTSSFVDGMNFSGSGIHAQKTFTVFRQGPNGGIWAMETSPTLETN